MQIFGVVLEEKPQIRNPNYAKTYFYIGVVLVGKSRLITELIQYFFLNIYM